MDMGIPALKQTSWDRTGKLEYQMNYDALFNAVCFRPHTGQREFLDICLDDRFRFYSLICGRRWGKSLLAGMWGAGFLLLPNTRGWVVSKTYDLTRKVIRELHSIVVVKMGLKPTTNQQGGPIKMEFPWGSTVEGKSADHPECYDEQTEILTDSGWKAFRDLLPSERVLTLDPDTLHSEWHYPKHYISEDYDGVMYKLANDRLVLLVTPNHQFFVESRDGVKKFVPISEIPRYSHDSIPSRT